MKKITEVKSTTTKIKKKTKMEKKRKKNSVVN